VEICLEASEFVMQVPERVKHSFLQLDFSFIAGLMERRKHM
jgi:hypothetical protein